MTLIKTELLNVVLCASKDPNRLQLDGVFLEISSAQNIIRCTSTNGHCLASMQSTYSSDNSGIKEDLNGTENKSTIIPTDTVLQVLDTCKKQKVNQVDIELVRKTHNTEIVISIGCNKIVSEAIEMKFMDYIKVIPKLEATKGPRVFSFDPDLILKFKKILKAIGQPQNLNLHFSDDKGLSPAISCFDFADIQVLFLIMPIQSLNKNETEEESQNKQDTIKTMFSKIEVQS